MTRRAQTLFGNLLVWGMMFLIFVFSAPLLLAAIGVSVSTGPISFLVKVMPWIILLLIVNRVYRLVATGGAQ